MAASRRHNNNNSIRERGAQEAKEDGDPAGEAGEQSVPAAGGEGQDTQATPGEEEAHSRGGRRARPGGEAR